MEMEGSYGLSQRAEITWQHQRKGQKKKSERNTVTDIQLHAAVFISENNNTGLRFLCKQSLHAIFFLPNFKLKNNKHP